MLISLHLFLIRDILYAYQKGVKMLTTIKAIMYLMFANLMIIIVMIFVVSMLNARISLEKRYQAVAETILER